MKEGEAINEKYIGVFISSQMLKNNVYDMNIPGASVGILISVFNFYLPFTVSMKSPSSS